MHPGPAQSPSARCRRVEGEAPQLGPFGALHRGPGNRVAGMLEVGPLGVELGHGGPLAHVHADVLGSA